VREAVSLSGGGSPLPDSVGRSLQRGLGVDLHGLRVHTGARAATAAAHLGVRAFTWGRDIFLGPGEQPNDERLMAHEAAHAVQQTGGAAVHLFDGPHGGLEAEAHAVSATVAAGGTTRVTGSTTGGLVQGLFGIDVKGKVLEFVKEKASVLPGYDLLGFALGRDPITEKPVERTPVTFVKGVLGLVPGGLALFDNLQKANVIQRAFDWFSAEVTKLGLTWPYIRGLFSRAWDALSFTDLASPSSAWDKLKAIFGPPLGRITSFVVAAGKKVFEFVFEGALALAGSAGQQILAVFRRIGSVFSLVVEDPLKFLGNLISAVKGGVGKFKDNILAHLRTGLFEWLLGSLEGVSLPKTWDFGGILSLILQILGLTYQALRKVLVKLIGEPAVAIVETAFDFLVTVVTKGLGAAWQKIKEFAAGLADTVIGAIRDWLVKSVVGAAITKLITLFNPVGAIIQGIITIYNTVMFFIERAQQIARLVNAVLDSVENIARGNLGAAIAFVEKTMASTIPVILGFLARFVGLGNVTKYVRDIITKIRTTISDAMEKVGLWIKDKVKSLLGGKQADASTPEGKSAQVRSMALAELTKDLGDGSTPEQATQAVRRVEGRLRPQGLEKLEAGTADAEGLVTVKAAASPFLPLAKLAPRGQGGGRATVKLFAEIRFAEAHNLGAATILPVDKEGRPLQAGEASRRTAGSVITSTRGGDELPPNVVRTVSYNTANLNIHGNVSHAEHHFVSWLSSQTNLPAVQSITLNLQDFSPCAICTDELIGLIRQLVTARGRAFDRGKADAVLTWTKPYPGIRPGGDNRTTKPGVDALIGAGWKVHAPPVKEGDPLRDTQIVIVAPDYKPPA
jgi:Domain of unknown function (DUF4157)